MDKIENSTESGKDDDYTERPVSNITTVLVERARLRSNKEDAETAKYYTDAVAKIRKFDLMNEISTNLKESNPRLEFSIALYCDKINLSPTSPLCKRQGIMGMAWFGPAVPKNEKRYYIVSESKPYPIQESRADKLVFTTIYKSEVNEQTSKFEANLPLNIMCPEMMDQRLRISVYYSSSLTNGYVRIGMTTFTARECYYDCWKGKGQLTSIFEAPPFISMHLENNIRLQCEVIRCAKYPLLSSSLNLQYKKKLRRRSSTNLPVESTEYPVSQEYIF